MSDNGSLWRRTISCIKGFSSAKSSYAQKYAKSNLLWVDVEF
jgi:hypothetical protein